MVQMGTMNKIPVWLRLRHMQTDIVLEYDQSRRKWHREEYCTILQQGQSNVDNTTT